MKIVTTANLGLAILLGCTLGMGAVGWYGSQRLADLLAYVLGSAWQTADGAMEGSIELGNQQLQIQKMQNGTPLNRAELDAAKAATDEALARVSQGQLIDGAALSSMEQQKQAYQQQQEKLLTLYHAYTEADQALHHNADLMARLSTQLEEIGDGAVETLTQSPRPDHQLEQWPLYPLGSGRRGGWSPTSAFCASSMRWRRCADRGSRRRSRPS